MVLEETYENIDHLDLTYLMFVWIAFLPAALTPWIYATWMLSRSVYILESVNKFVLFFHAQTEATSKKGHSYDISLGNKYCQYRAGPQDVPIRVSIEVFFCDLKLLFVGFT